MAVSPTQLRPTRRRVTRQEFARAVSEGLSVYDAARRFEVTPNTVRASERRFGLRCRRRTRSSLVDEGSLRKLVAEGLNSVQMAEKLKVSSPGVVYYYLRKYGIDYQSQRAKGPRLLGAGFDAFAEQLRKRFGGATVLVRGTAVMIDGELVGEEGERWFRDKARTAFPRKGQFSL